MAHLIVISCWSLVNLGAIPGLRRYRPAVPSENASSCRPVLRKVRANPVGRHRPQHPPVCRNRVPPMPLQLRRHTPQRQTLPLRPTPNPLYSQRVGELSFRRNGDAPSQKLQRPVGHAPRGRRREWEPDGARSEWRSGRDGERCHGAGVTALDNRPPSAGHYIGSRDGSAHFARYRRSVEGLPCDGSMPFSSQPLADFATSAGSRPPVRNDSPHFPDFPSTSQIITPAFFSHASRSSG